SKAPRAAARPLLDDRRERGDREELARHRDVGAFVAQRLAQDPFAFAEPVDFGGVEQRDPQRTGALHDVTRGAGGVAVAVAPLARAKLPGAQTNPADLADSVDVEIFHRGSLTGDLVEDVGRDPLGGLTWTAPG